MPIKLNNTAQTPVFFMRLEQKMYEKFHKISLKNGLVRAIAPITMISSVVLTLSSRVSHVGESLIKGLANIFCSPFVEGCSVLKGLRQIFINCPMGLVSLACTPLTIYILVMTNLQVLPQPERTLRLLNEYMDEIIENIEEIISSSSPPRKATENYEDRIRYLMQYQEYLKYF